MKTVLIGDSFSSPAEQLYYLKQYFTVVKQLNPTVDFQFNIVLNELNVSQPFERPEYQIASEMMDLFQTASCSLFSQTDVSLQPLRLWPNGNAQNGFILEVNQQINLPSSNIFNTDVELVSKQVEPSDQVFVLENQLGQVLMEKQVLNTAFFVETPYTVSQIIEDNNNQYTCQTTVRYDPDYQQKFNTIVISKRSNHKYRDVICIGDILFWCFDIQRMNDDEILFPELIELQDYVILIFHKEYKISNKICSLSDLYDNKNIFSQYFLDLLSVARHFQTYCDFVKIFHNRNCDLMPMFESCFKNTLKELLKPSLFGGSTQSISIPEQLVVPKFDVDAITNFTAKITFLQNLQGQFIEIDFIDALTHLSISKASSFIASQDDVIDTIINHEQKLTQFLLPTNDDDIKLFLPLVTKIHFDQEKYFRLEYLQYEGNCDLNILEYKEKLPDVVTTEISNYFSQLFNMQLSGQHDDEYQDVIEEFMKDFLDHDLFISNQISKIQVSVYPGLAQVQKFKNIMQFFYNYVVNIQSRQTSLTEMVKCFKISLSQQNIPSNSLRNSINILHQSNYNDICMLFEQLEPGLATNSYDYFYSETQLQEADGRRLASVSFYQEVSITE